MEMDTERSEGAEVAATGAASEEGWFTDPYGIHEARWLSEGRPTQLVRDSGSESYDKPPDRPPVAPPERIVSLAEVLPTTQAVVTHSRANHRRSFLTTAPGLDFHVDLMIGTNEKHLVSYDWAQFWGTTTISVDGVEVLRKRKTFMFIRTKWRYELLVGHHEVHRLAVDQTIPWFWGGLRIHTFQFFVDDQLVYTY